MKKGEKFQGQGVQKWKHPGGKLREFGADKLSDSELLAILISTGTKNKSAETIAGEIIGKFGSFHGLVDQPLSNLLEIKGLGDVKIIRIAASFELARRIANEIVEGYEQK
jgi:DNA repair protein RadC